MDGWGPRGGLKAVKSLDIVYNKVLCDSVMVGWAL